MHQSRSALMPLPVRRPCADHPGHGDGTEIQMSQVWGAEQVAVGAPLPLVVQYLGATRTRWLRPLLMIACHEAEQRSNWRRRECEESRAEELVHEVQVTPFGESANGAVFHFEWRMSGERGIFGHLVGDLHAGPLETVSCIAFRGCLDRDSSSDGPAMRPAEIVVRCLLGHLGAALADAARSN